ncbi:MAG: succinylglutamate desuccinylase/aspartoacylase family protein [Bdellovibrionales bacterium]|nr:succinylglutamate desuccinylase/aspartoacylase family protein [Bdellovibrionales bacterium]
MTPIDTPVDDRFKRIIGRISADDAGPCVIVTAGMHGNELAGVFACQRVAAKLTTLSSKMKGDFVAITGNMHALTLERRFIQEDLNRVWSDDRISQVDLEGSFGGNTVESAEAHEVLISYREAASRARGDIVSVDLHSTSSGSVPFCFLMDPERDLPLGRKLPMPCVVGLRDLLVGTFSQFASRNGACAIAVEAGQHNDPATVDNHEAAVWVVLFEAGVISPNDVPGAHRYYELLEMCRGGLPNAVEIVHRHGIRLEDEFRMQPGFQNFHTIKEGELLAIDRHGEIRADRGALLFLPLYQKQGDDGFFLVEPWHG